MIILVLHDDFCHPFPLFFIGLDRFDRYLFNVRFRSCFPGDDFIVVYSHRVSDQCNLKLLYYKLVLHMTLRSLIKLIDLNFAGQAACNTPVGGRV